MGLCDFLHLNGWYTDFCLPNMDKVQKFLTASQAICCLVSSLMCLCLWLFRATPQTDKYAPHSMVLSSVTKQLRTPLTDRTACERTVDVHAA